jgi:glycolate oxidase FAD binding subunit
VKPLSEHSVTIVADCSDFETANTLHGRLAQLEVPPVAIDLLVGEWALPISTTASVDDIRSRIAIAVRVEGSESEIAWLAEQIQYELWTGGGTNVRRLNASEADALWKQQIEFTDRGPRETPDESPLVLKIAVPPSATTAMIAAVQQCDPECTIQAHAGNGILVARFARFTHADLTNVLVAKLRPTAIKLGGSAVVVASKLAGLTPHIVWGGRTEAIVLLERIKQKFDPHHILNPGRFVF